MVCCITKAVGRAIRTVGTTGISVHLVKGSTTIPARTITERATADNISRVRAVIGEAAIVVKADAAFQNSPWDMA